MPDQPRVREILPAEAQQLIDAGAQNDSNATDWWRSRVTFILDHGSLARRILRAVDGDFSRERLHDVYARMCACLDQGKMFE